MMLPSLSFNNALIVMATLALSVLSVLALISIRRRARKFTLNHRHGSQHSRSTPSRAERSLSHLISGLDNVAGITSCAVVTTSGKLIIGSADYAPANAQATSVLLAMYKFSHRMSNDLGRDRLEQVMVRGNNGLILVESMGEDVFLLVTINPDADYERVAKKVTLAAEKIQEILTQPRR